MCTKFGFKYEDGAIMCLDSNPASVRRACEGCLKRLSVDCIDLFYQHRVDLVTPIEDTIRELKVDAGVAHCLGLCAYFSSLHNFSNRAWQHRFKNVKHMGLCHP